MSELSEAHKWDDLTVDEQEMLMHVAMTSADVKSRDRDERYLKWGKYLFDHSIVSEYDLITPDEEVK